MSNYSAVLPVRQLAATTAGDMLSRHCEKAAVTTLVHKVCFVDS